MSASSSKLQVFTDTKHRVVAAIDFRLDRLNENLMIFERSGFKYLTEDTRSRIDELESLRSFVKGMVIENEKKKTDTLK